MQGNQVDQEGNSMNQMGNFLARFMGDGDGERSYELMHRQASQSREIKKS